MISAVTARATIFTVSHSTSKFTDQCRLMIKQNRSVTEYPVYLRFPLEEEHRRLWIVNMGKDAEWTPSESSSLCSAHFTPDCFESGSACLHSDAIPTVFNFTQTEVSLSIFIGLSEPCLFYPYRIFYKRVLTKNQVCNSTSKC